MQIIIDTSKDSPDEIRKAARFLQELADGKTGIANQGNIFENPTQTEGLMNIFGSPAASSGNSSASSDMTKKEIPAGQEGIAQKIIESSFSDEKDILGNPLTKKDSGNNEKKGSSIIVY